MNTTSNITKLIDELKSGINQDNLQNEDLNKLLEIESTNNKSLMERLKSKENQISKLETVVSEMRSFKDENRKELAEIKMFVSRAERNIITQVNSFLNLHNYFIHGSTPISQGGYPVSSDVALFLVDHLRDNNFDLILEFGSGVSTLMISKVINEEETKFISFEHHNGYYEETKKMLALDGVLNKCNLQYSPLEDVKYDGENYLYYSCSNALKKLSKNTKNNKILFFIDGPPESTCKNARMPIIKYIFKYFIDRDITFILDDFNRPGEKKIIEDFTEGLSSRGIPFSARKIETERGLCVLKINNTNE